jgi:hypothetical protein
LLQVVAAAVLLMVVQVVQVVCLLVLQRYHQVLHTQLQLVRVAQAIRLAEQRQREVAQTLQRYLLLLLAVEAAVLQEHTTV